MKIVIIGNSGAGKSTLAKKIASSNAAAHLDLDTLAWLPEHPPKRMSKAQSSEHIQAFVLSNKAWVIEGCYADLIELVLPLASELIFLNLPLESCIANARARPWEPHKYESKAAQDANLEMLIDWIKQYEHRDDTFSKKAHQALFDSFDGPKHNVTSNEHYQVDD